MLEKYRRWRSTRYSTECCCIFSLKLSLRKLWLNLGFKFLLVFPILRVSEVWHGMLYRSPLVTIKTHAYHFCKLSFIKKPGSFRVPVSRNNFGSETREADELGSLGDTEGQVQGNSTEHFGDGLASRLLFRISLMF